MRILDFRAAFLFEDIEGARKGCSFHTQRVGNQRFVIGQVKGGTSFAIARALAQQEAADALRRTQHGVKSQSAIMMPVMFRHRREHIEGQIGIKTNTLAEKIRGDAEQDDVFNYHRAIDMAFLLENRILAEGAGRGEHIDNHLLPIRHGAEKLYPAAANDIKISGQIRLMKDDAAFFIGMHPHGFLEQPNLAIGKIREQGNTAHKM